MIDEIEVTLELQGYDYKKWIDDIVQVAAVEQRQQGKRFTLREHVRAGC